MPSTWIKLDRNILSWGWYTEANTMRLFVHLLLKANVKDGKFRNVEVKRGELVTSCQKLSDELDIKPHLIRTALSHLKSTGEITIKTTSKFSVISIPKYEEYQGNSQTKSQTETQSGRKQNSNEPQQYKNRRKRTVKKDNKEDQAPETAEDKSEKYIPEVWEVDKPKEYWGRFKTETEYYAYMQSGGE